MMAYELDAAVALAGFNDDQHIVLHLIRAQTYGMAKAKTALLNSQCVADMAAIYRQNARRAIRSLVDSGVLVPLENDHYRFIKDYEKWTFKGEPRITGKRLLTCKEAPIYAKGFRQADKHGSGIKIDSKQESELIPTADAYESELIPKGIKIDSKQESELIPTFPENVVAIEESPGAELIAGEVSGEGNKGEKETPLPPSIFQPETEAEFREWAKGVVTEIEHFDSKITGMLRSYPLDWVFAATLEATVHARHGGIAAYAHGCLRKWKSAGKMPTHADQAAAPAPKPTAADRIFGDLEKSRVAMKKMVFADPIPIGERVRIEREKGQSKETA